MQDAFTVSKSDHERENRRADGQKAGGVHRCSKTHAEGGPVRGVSRTKVLDEKLNLVWATWNTWEAGRQGLTTAT